MFKTCIACGAWRRLTELPPVINEQIQMMIICAISDTDDNRDDYCDICNLYFVFVSLFILSSCLWKIMKIDGIQTSCI